MTFSSEWKNAPKISQLTIPWSVNYNCFVISILRKGSDQSPNSARYKPRKWKTYWKKKQSWNIKGLRHQDPMLSVLENSNIWRKLRYGTFVSSRKELILSSCTYVFSVHCSDPGMDTYSVFEYFFNNKYLVSESPYIFSVIAPHIWK